MADLFVVGVDGSEGSRRALYVAAHAAYRLDARLLVAHVIAESPGADLVPTAPELAFGQQAHEVDEAHAHMLEPMVAEARDLGVPVELKTLHGDPATTLAERLARKTTVPVTLVP